MGTSYGSLLTISLLTLLQLWNLILTRYTPNLIQALKKGGVVSLIGKD